MIEPINKYIIVQEYTKSWWRMAYEANNKRTVQEWTKKSHRIFDEVNNWITD